MNYWIKQLCNIIIYIVYYYVAKPARNAKIWSEK